MKKILFAVLLVLVAGLAGCNSFEEKKARKAITMYYDALMKSDYDAAFKNLFLYENGITTPTDLSLKEAESVYAQKMDHLEKRGYKVRDYKIRGVEYEDGHTFWHHIDVVVEVEGTRKKFSETAFYQNGKLSISGDDPFAPYRDGKMDVELEG